jgi:hypothetical protein
LSLTELSSLPLQLSGPQPLPCEERLSDSPYVDLVWRSQSDQETPFTSVAQTRWGIVVSKIDNAITITVRGPETQPTHAVSPAHAEFMGILFKPGVFMPTLPPDQLADRHDMVLPNCSSDSFWLNSSTWNFPVYDNAEIFVDWMVRDDLIRFDTEIENSLKNSPSDLATRTIERRFKRATGLTRGTLEQIKRARYATYLLQSGVSTQDAVAQAGYFDQSHLIRSLKRFIGYTPQQLIAGEQGPPLSFLYNTLLTP